MEIVIEQSKLQGKLVTYQQPIPNVLKCRKCKGEARIIMLVHDDKKELVVERPKGVRVWPHDSSVTYIYLCTECGAMRATWNQG